MWGVVSRLRSRSVRIGDLLALFWYVLTLNITLNGPIWTIYTFSTLVLIYLQTFLIRQLDY